MKLSRFLIVAYILAVLALAGFARGAQASATVSTSFDLVVSSTSL